jgi:hypothetical protein
MIRLLILIFITSVIAQECKTRDTFPIDGSCQHIRCSNDDACSSYAKYCDQYGIICKFNYGNKECLCRGKWEGDRYGNSGGCNRALNGNDKCKTGEVCPPGSGAKCIPDPKCSFFGEQCDTQSCCANNGYCHQRKGTTGKTCLNTAFVKEECTGGIPCENGSQCINGICSLRPNDSCDDGGVCPSNTSCQHIGLNDSNINKACV